MSASFLRLIVSYSCKTGWVFLRLEVFYATAYLCFSVFKLNIFPVFR